MSVARKQTKNTASKTEQAGFALPELPSLLTRPLGLEGWTMLEPALLAALATGDPLLLIGPHGSAKSFLLERLAQVLAMEYRFYNASLINFDDLVGIPLPDEERLHLRYISTRSSIWEAEIVFIDEINRTRPELQNKLFPIIHERRVQGIPLEKLRYRWAAMNPPPTGREDGEDLDVYFGTEPLDPALADRFCLILEVPSWQQLSDREKHSILQDQFHGQHPFPVPPTELICSASEKYERLQVDPPKAIADYLIYLFSLLEEHKLICSARRATIIHRTILAVHAARMALYQQAFPDFPPQAVDWNTSALIALQNSLPQTAQGRKPDPVFLLAAHRQAWEITHIDQDNPWRMLLQIKDPVQRCLAAIKMEDRISPDDLSQLILTAVASLPEREYRLSFSLAVYLAVRSRPGLRAVVFESLAGQVRPALVQEQPAGSVKVSDELVRRRCREAAEQAAELKEGLKSVSENGQRDAHLANILNTLIAEEQFTSATPRQVAKYFHTTWAELFNQAKTTTKESNQ